MHYLANESIAGVSDKEAAGSIERNSLRSVVEGHPFCQGIVSVGQCRAMDTMQASCAHLWHAQCHTQGLPFIPIEVSVFSTQGMVASDRRDDGSICRSKKCDKVHSTPI